MSILKWLEKKLVLGEVLRDYGNIHDETNMMVRERTSLLLCRRKGKLRIIFRHLATAPMSASVHYSKVEVTPESLARFGEIILDANKHLAESQTVRRT